VREIVADKRCENGHFIDESWDLCPYCPAEQAEAEIPVVRPNRFASEPGGGSPATAPGPGPRAVPAPTPAPDAAPRVVPAPISSAAPPSGIRRAEAVAQAAPMERTMAVQKVDPGLQPKRYVVGWLVGLNGTVRGESYPVRMGRNVLGRDRRSDIVVNDDQASSHHADLVFRPEERRFILMDHNSTNGTYVNETEIEPRRDLILEDVIRIGSHRFIFMPLCRDGFYWDDEGALK
jgi:hypothetical protein